MPTFEAKTKAEMRGEQPAPPAPIEETPAADFEFLRPLGENSSWPRVWQLRVKQHTLHDVLVPGFFRGEVREMLRPGDEIFLVCEGGEKVPSKWERGVVCVDEIPSAKELPLIVAPVSY